MNMDNRRKIITASLLFVGIYLFLLLTDNPEAFLLSLITYAVFSGFEMIKVDENGHYTYDRLSVLLCCFSNVLVFVVNTGILIRAGKKSSAEVIFVYILTVIISIMIGYKIHRSDLKKRMNAWTGAEDWIDRDGVHVDPTYENWRSYYEKEYAKYANIHNEQDDPDKEARYEHFKEEYKKYHNYNNSFNNSGDSSERSHDQNQGNRTSEYKTNNYTRHKYFRGCTSKQEVKRRFRELSKMYHPDNPNTGNAGIFVEIKAEYDEIINAA